MGDFRAVAHAQQESGGQVVNPREVEIRHSKHMRSKCEILYNTIELNNKTIHYLML